MGQIFFRQSCNVSANSRLLVYGKTMLVTNVTLAKVVLNGTVWNRRLGRWAKLKQIHTKTANANAFTEPF